jgi:hypothetical protein
VAHPGEHEIMTMVMMRMMRQAFSTQRRLVKKKKYVATEIMK